MKSLLAFAFCIVSFATISCSQKITEKELPAPVKTTFSKAYDKPGKVKWNKEGKNEYEASFILNGKDISVVYSDDGVLQETETEISVAELPAAVTDYVTKNYKNTKIGEAAKIIKKDGSVVYEAEVNKKDLLFDVSGKLLSKEN